MAEAWFFILNLLYVSAAAGVAFAMVRVADKILGINFKQDVLGEINGNPTAAGLYYGLRWFGVCWLVAQALS